MNTAGPRRVTVAPALGALAMILAFPGSGRAQTGPQDLAHLD